MYALAWEQACIDQAVADVFGFHAVQLGDPALDGLRANRMPHRVRVLLPDDPLPGGEGSCLRVAHFEELPFESHSIDLVLLPHVLETTADPHQVLREVDRVLRPEGRLILTGFNPVSLWGLHNLSAGSPIAEPLAGASRLHLIGVPRLRDWCKLLRFEFDEPVYGCFRPPCRTAAGLERMRFMERAGDRWWPICGGVYLASAIKRVRGMRLLGPAWKRSPRVGVALNGRPEGVRAEEGASRVSARISARDT